MDALIALIQKMPGTADMSAQALHITAASTMAVLMFTIMALCAIVFTLMERKVAGFIQNRYGPMRTGRWHGWAQAVADMLKILGKEDIIPADADKNLFLFAPVLVLLGSLLAWAAIPWAPGVVPADLDIPMGEGMPVSLNTIFGTTLTYDEPIYGWDPKCESKCISLSIKGYFNNA